MSRLFPGRGNRDDECWYLTDGTYGTRCSSAGTEWVRFPGNEAAAFRQGHHRIVTSYKLNIFSCILDPTASGKSLSRVALWMGVRGSMAVRYPFLRSIHRSWR